MAGKSFIFRFAEVEVREREFSIVKAGEVLAVEPKAFRVLLVLLRGQGKLIEKEELLNAVWGDAAVTDNSLARSIALLRRLLGDEARTPRFIETVSTVGYRFICAVEVAEDVLPTPGADGQQAEGDAGAAPSALAAVVGGRSKRLRWMVLGSAAVLALACAGISYLSRPLPPPHVTRTTKLTFDGHPKWAGGTDGTRVFINSLSDLVIYEVGTEGGAMVKVPVAAPGDGPYVMDVSADGAHMLVGSGEENWKKLPMLWNVRIPDGSYSRLGNAWQAAYSPDGSSVAYLTAEGEIWLVRSDGTGAHKLASPGGGEQSLAWSPDGSRIRFDKENTLWEISPNGSNLHQLLIGWHSTGFLCCGRWTPEGNFFVFRSSPDLRDEGEQLWVLDERRGLFRRPSGTPIQLTSGPIAWDNPAPSKDGKRIFASGYTSLGELSRVDPRTAALRPFLGGISAFDLSFSSDGQFVTYISYPDVNLWRANRDGSSPMQLTSRPISPAAPRWSPDGSLILFVDRASGHEIAYIVPSEGGIPKRILPEDKGNEVDPNWSSDGREMVFCSSGPEDPRSALSIFDFESNKVTMVPGSVGSWSPRWSPDGRFIAAISSDEAALKIFEVSAERWTTLPMKGQLSNPIFSRNSKYIYFLLRDKKGSGNYGIFRLSVSGGNPVLFEDLKGWHFSKEWLGLDDEGAPLLVRDAGTDDIYALTLEAK